MDFARYDSRMRQPADKAGKVSMRVALEKTAARGVKSAQKMLDGPEFPDAMSGLWDQFQTLDRMRSYGMHGANALTPSDIASADRLFDWALQPHEVEALAALDVVSRFPGDEEED